MTQSEYDPKRVDPKRVPTAVDPVVCGFGVMALGWMCCGSDVLWVGCAVGGWGEQVRRRGSYASSGAYTKILTV